MAKRPPAHGKSAVANVSSSATGGVTRKANLGDALRGKTPTLIYGASAVQDVVQALESASNKTISPVDCRGDAAVASMQAALDEQRQTGGLVVVLLGIEMSAGARAALVDIAETGTMKLVAVTPARAPSDTMAALFPMQLAAASALAGAR